jgi:hypothetical protein
MAIGDLLATISVNSAGTLALASNPNGYFSISGLQLLDASGAIPAGAVLPFSISTTALGIPTVYPFVMITGDTVPPSGGPMDFSVPGNLPESPAGATI